MQRCVNMLKQDLHTAGVSALGTMWVVLFPKMGQGIDADTLATPSCTYPSLGFSPGPPNSTLPLSLVSVSWAPLMLG